MRRAPAATARTEEAKNHFWQGHVEGWQRSGMSQRDYCSQRGLSLSTFTWWRRRLAAQVRPARSNIVDLVAVPLRPVAVTTRLVTPPVVVLLGAGQYRVELMPGFDMGTLRAVVATLEATV